MTSRSSTVEWLQRPRSWLILGVSAALLFLVWQLWVWEVERVEVPPNHILVKINLWGKNLPAGEILAPSNEYKGILLETLGPGRHFLNPLFYAYEIKPMVVVPPGECLVLTRKFGKEISPARLARGDVLAREGEKGILREPKPPGLHEINPYAYAYEIVPMVKVARTQVGVKTIKVGVEPEQAERKASDSPYLVKTDPKHEYRGVQDQPLPPRDYPVNPYVETIAPVDLDDIRVTFDDIVFPSLDGFTVKPEVTVTYRVQPEKAPHLLVTLTDSGHLYQKYQTPQDREKNQILQKIVLPVIRGHVRIEGSKFKARDFIAEAATQNPDDKTPNARIRLQEALQRTVPLECKEVGIIIKEVSLNRLIAQDELEKLGQQITERVTSLQKRITNENTIKKLESEAENKANEAKVKQSGAVTAAMTDLERTKIQMQQKLKILEAELTTQKEAAQIRLEAAKSEATKILALAESEAKVAEKQNLAEIADIKTAIQGFPGVDTFAQYHMVKALGPALAEIFASDGSEFAKLFAGFMASPPKGKQ
jgi:regulator of protease activity HflC (stomatin/prohibitin superfamily)